MNLFCFNITEGIKMIYTQFVTKVLRCLFFTVALLSGTVIVKAGDSLMIMKEFNLITSNNASGYFKPLFTTIGESFNSNTFTVAHFAKQWRLGIDISASGMIIPSSQKTYDAYQPEDYGNTSVTQTSEIRDGVVTRNKSGRVVQPTIYGGNSTPTFSTPQTSMSPSNSPKQPSTVTYLEGNNINFMSGLPAVQINAAFPTRTQLRVRYLPVPIDDRSLTYFGIMGSQQFNHLVGLFADDSLVGIALNAGYHSLSRNLGISVSSFAIGLHGSKTWNSGLSVYGGLQYENLSGTITFVREKDANDVSKSPFAEIRDQKDLKIDVESFTNLRLGAGVSYKTGIVELHADAALASQPVLSVGISFWFMSIDSDTKDSNLLDNNNNINNEKKGDRP